MTVTDKPVYAIVVLYNKNAKDSLTLKSIKNHDFLNIIVCDNSTKDFENQNLSAEGYTYIPMNGNMGLSKAYNKAIDTIPNKEGTLCLFDDDTEIPQDYFEKVLLHVKENPKDIFFPMVYDAVGLMSPGVMRKYLCYRAKCLEELVNDEFTGINSGMVIDLSVFENYRYDEHIFLDYVDHNFIRDMRKAGKTIGIMEDVTLQQTFSDVVNDQKGASIRFSILKKDLKYFYRETFASRCFYHYVIGKRRIKLCLKYKTLDFLFL